MRVSEMSTTKHALRRTGVSHTHQNKATFNSARKYEMGQGGGRGEQTGHDLVSIGRDACKSQIESNAA